MSLPFVTCSNRGQGNFWREWHYDILRALDYFQAVNATRDPRLTEAIEIVRGSQGEDGRWEGKR